ncbi:hypothetical protein COP2_003642 [Malus domestica]
MVASKNSTVLVKQKHKHLDGNLRKLELERTTFFGPPNRVHVLELFADFGPEQPLLQEYSFDWVVDISVNGGEGTVRMGCEAFVS